LGRPALHDWLAGTTVQIRDLELLRSRDFMKKPARPRSPAEDPARPRFSQGPTMD